MMHTRAVSGADPIPAGIDRSKCPDFLPPAGGVETKHMTEKIEYRVRMVPRYMVTRYACDLNGEVDAASNGSTQHGQFDNEEVAYEVAYALCSAEHARLGWPIADERIQYPRRYDEDQCIRAATLA